MPHRNDMENIFPHVHGWKSKNPWKFWMKIEHRLTFWIIIACRQIVWMKDLSNQNVWMKLITKELCRMKTTCTWMIVIINMKYLDECGAWMNFWMIIGNWQIIGWIFLLIEYMDENNSKTIMMNGNYWTHIIFMSNFIQKKRCQRWNSKELHYNAKRWNNNLCYELNEVT
jgi:hypothetical protein